MLIPSQSEILYRLKEHEFISIYQMIFQQDFSQDVVVTVLVPRASDLAHIVWRAGDSLQCWLARTGLARTNNRHQPRPGPGAPAGQHQPQ